MGYSINITCSYKSNSLMLRHLKRKFNKIAVNLEEIQFLKIATLSKYLEKKFNSQLKLIPSKNLQDTMLIKLLIS